jgi:hypothetical protein
MTVLALSPSPASGTQVSSPYGPAFWYGNTANVQCSINPDNGAGWVIYQVKSSGLPAGEVVNGIRIQGVHDFLVGGGAGTGRGATGVWKWGHATTDFIGASADGTFGPVLGSGVGQNINFVSFKAGFTTTDINNGTFYIGFSVGSDNGNPGVGMGAATYRNACFGWTVFAGTDQPTPPPTATVVTIINPASNVNPGVVPGGQFAAVDLTLNQVLPQTSFQFRCNLPANMTWAANGSGFQAILRGTSNNPGDPYHASTGLINVASNCLAGSYTFEVNTTGGSLGNVYQYVTLVVLGPSMMNAGFHEF